MDQLIGAAKVPDNLIKDTDTQRFRADVLDASMSAPVIVDFWATWCGPCKQLGPILEKAVKEAKGAVRLAKIDVDRNQELAAQMRIQSIPAVYAFFQGRPVDGFVGMQSESQVKSFVQRLAKLAKGDAAGASPIDEALEQAEAALAEGGHDVAAGIFQQILAHEPDNAKALAGLLRALIGKGETAAARDLLARLPKERQDDPAIAALRTQLDLAAAGEKMASAIPALRARLAAEPKDFQARQDLALALFAGGEREAAIEQLIESIRLDRRWNEEAARKQLLQFLEAMGPGDPLTAGARRRLSSLLFS